MKTKKRLPLKSKPKIEFEYEYPDVDLCRRTATLKKINAFAVINFVFVCLLDFSIINPSTHRWTGSQLQRVPWPLLRHAHSALYPQNSFISSFQPSTDKISLALPAPPNLSTGSWNHMFGMTLTLHLPNSSISRQQPPSKRLYGTQNMSGS